MRKFLLILIPLLALGIGLAIVLRPQQDQSPSSKQKSSENDDAKVSVPVASENIVPETHSTPTPMPSAAPKSLDPNKENLVADLLATGGGQTEFASVGFGLSTFFNMLKTTSAKSAFNSEGVFTSKIFEETYKKNLSEKLSAEELKELNALHKQGPMQSYLQAQTNYLSESGRKKTAENFKTYDAHPPSAERLRLLEELDTASHISESGMATMKSINERLVDLTKKGSIIEVRPQLFKQSALVQLAVCLSDKSDGELQALTQAFASPVKQKEVQIRQESLAESLRALGN